MITFRAHRFASNLCLSLLCAWSNVALGADVPGFPDQVEAFDSREVAMLPAYCKYTQVFREHVPGGNDAAEIERLTTVLGPTFNAMHHYCWGLMKTNRGQLLARSQQSKMFYLNASISEFDYVIERAPEDFVLLPEILAKKGQNLILVGRAAQGVRELERAIKLKPDYWPPYAALSDYYKSSGDLGKARELLEQALAFAPETKGLTRRRDELYKLQEKKGAANR